MRPSFLRQLAVLAALLGACTHEDLPLEGEGTDTDGPDVFSVTIWASREVDVLFVIDNSATMGSAQARLVAAIPAFMAALDDPAHPIDYRVAVTTSDNGNPQCPESSPESGALQISSCRERLGEFVTDADPSLDVVSLACTDACSLDTIGIDATATRVDPVPSPRPWIESVAGETNLADGVTPAEALRCILPPGISGCGFEAPLESMYRAIERSSDPADPQYGFVRDAATFAVVLMSDEVDCSYNPEFENVFLAEIDGGTTPIYWSDPEASAPTSAVCWNAGVICEGSGMPYDSCRTSNKNTAGFEDIPEADAVIHPIRRYILELEGVRQNKLPPGDLVAAYIHGVPEDGEIVYAVSPDEGDRLEYGIGPGCTYDDDGDPTTPDATARPPLREKELTDWFALHDTPLLHSICASDFSPYLTAIAERVRDQLGPACISRCVADTDSAAGLQPQCTLTREMPDSDGDVLFLDVPMCMPGGALPAGETECFEMRTDDALAPQCAEQGWNVEVRVVRAPGVAAGPVPYISVECEWSQDRETDCPNLP